MNKKIDKAALASRILTLEGISSEDKSALLELLSEQKRYGLVWEDSPEEVETLLREKLPVLTEDTTKRILSPLGESEGAAPNHILIEGDNYPALVALQYAYEGKVDVIYIDPPYNTGNKDFIYNDSFVDNEDGYRHSKWLSFMSKRLRIAKRLLSDRGVIFISIDDNEQANLKLLCDEVFGVGNFVGTYFWKKTSTPPALSYKIRRKIEYVLCFQKANIPQRTFVQGYVDGGDAPLLNGGNPIGCLEFPAGSVRFGIPDGLYTASSSYKIELIDPVIVKDSVNAAPFRASANFKWGQNNLEREVSEGTYIIIKSKQFSPRYQKLTKATKVPSNIIDEEVNVGTNEDAQKELYDLRISFDYAKPSSLIAYLSKMPFWEEKRIIILDFFAGSGTTLHATMQLNAEDGGHRQCILVTNNENNICEEVTYERNKRVIQGYTTPKGLQVEGLKNNNLRYYKVDFVEREKTAANQKELMKASTDLLCIKENLYQEETSFEGLKLHEQIARCFSDGVEGGKKMLVIYEVNAIPAIVKRIEQMTVDKENKLKVYVMAEGQYPYTEDFESVQSKVELRAMPHALYQAMRQVLPPPAEAENTEPEMEVSEEEADGSIYKSEEL